ncbi:MAG TPA: phenylalanine--tRNA ligase subunit beta [Candidatus Binataceae bacterium]|nr:phenylalanine--tRNA ligase subunit beta [Candidatus Binataceae bacterium]
MKLPLSWLAEFVTLEAEVGELCRRLTLAGLEVENVERTAAGFSEVFVARVLKVERHPNADRLNLCDVDAGAVGRFSVVCGAPNVRAGMTAPFARLGARLIGSGHGGGHRPASLQDAPPLQAAVIRGVRSEGMLCSERELGFSEDHAGILALPDDAPLGVALASYLRSDDTVLDVAITPNRGDCLSILGLAREVAALFGLKLKQPAVRAAMLKPRGGPATAPQTEYQTESVDGAGGALAVEILAPKLCPRYAGLPISGVKIGPSPIWMRRRLEQCGMRGLNNVVDATNYVMLELGQPLHAFDSAQIAARRIVVRRADQAPGGALDREFVTLDSVRRTLDPADLLIADPDKPLAIAGIMGGMNSEVGAATTSLVLESAYFEPMTIARTARRLGLRSEASYRFERAIDRGGQLRALARVAELIVKHAGGKISAAAVDAEPRPAPERQVMLDLGAVDSILGVAVPGAEVRERLRALGATVKPAGARRLTVTPPSFRPDLNETADLAEEIARLKGLAEIPAAVPERAATPASPNDYRSFMGAAREMMVGAGLTELRTIAFIAPADNQRYPGMGGDAVRVTNPLSAELSELRVSLAPGLLGALRFNLNREAAAFHAFEIGKVFALRDGSPVEHERLAALSYGDYALGAVGQPATAASFWTLKGVLEQWFVALGVAAHVGFAAAGEAEYRFLHPGRAARVLLDDRPIGYLGELHPAEAIRLELNSPCVLTELDLVHLIAYGFLPRREVIAPPRYPAIRRDLALVVDRDISAARMIAAIRESAPPLLESVEVFDVYEGGSIAPGRKSMALTCRYRGKDRTLTDEEVNRAHGELIDGVRRGLGAELRQ